MSLASPVCWYREDIFMFQNSEGAEVCMVQVSFPPLFRAPLPRGKREPSFLRLLPETLCIFCMVTSHVCSPLFHPDGALLHTLACALLISVPTAW